MLNMIFLFIGTTEINVIAAIVLLIFGGKKLPELMRGLGKGVKEFKEGVKDVKEEITEEDPARPSKEDASKPKDQEKAPKNE